MVKESDDLAKELNELELEYVKLEERICFVKNEIKKKKKRKKLIHRKCMGIINIYGVTIKEERISINMD